MRSQSFSQQLGILLLGDKLAMLIVTAIEFDTHGMMTTAGARMLTTFIPLVIPARYNAREFSNFACFCSGPGWRERTWNDSVAALIPGREQGTKIISWMKSQ